MGGSSSVDGHDVDRAEALGWASVYAVDQPGDASLAFDTPSTRYLALAGQVLLWVLALGYLLRVRVREDERTELLGPDAGGSSTHVVVRPAAVVTRDGRSGVPTCGWSPRPTSPPRPSSRPPPCPSST